MPSCSFYLAAIATIFLWPTQVMASPRYDHYRGRSSPQVTIIRPRSGDKVIIQERFPAVERDVLELRFSESSFLRLENVKPARSHSNPYRVYHSPHTRHTPHRVYHSPHSLRRPYRVHHSLPHRRGSRVRIYYSHP